MFLRARHHLINIEQDTALHSLRQLFNVMHKNKPEPEESELNLNLNLDVNMNMNSPSSRPQPQLGQ